MKNFSIRRVVQYGRYHYTSMRNSYLSMLLTMLAFPLVIGITSKSVISASEVSMPIYLFAGIAFALRTTWAMRNKGMRVMDSALPISKGERFTFMLFNLMVAYPLACFAMAALAILIVAPFSIEGTVAEAMNKYFILFAFHWDIVYIIVQIVTSASLLINIAARRSLLVAYVGAIVGIIAFTIGLSYVSSELITILYNSELDTWGELMILDILTNEKLMTRIIMTIFMSIPAVFYVLAYLALRRRQVKW